MKKLFITIGAAIAAIGTATAADIVEVSTPEGLVAAVQNADNSGKTVKLLNDITVGNVGMTVSGITLDLDGHTFANNNGDFMRVSDNVGDLHFKNGTFDSPGSVIVMQNGGAGAVSFENCTFTGLCFVYGSYGSISLKKCVSTCDYFVSPACGPYISMTVEDCCVATTQGYSPGGLQALFGVGYYSFDPNGRLMADHYATAESGIEKGVSYNYVVRKYPDVAQVITNGGTETNGFSSIGAAFAVCTSGTETLRLLDDIEVNGAVTFGGSLDFDLNGHSFSTTGGDFLKISTGRVVFRNGRLSSTASVFILSGGEAVVENCVISGVCMLYGTGGQLTFNSGRVESNMFISKNCGSGLTMCFNDGFAVPTQMISENGTTGAKVVLNGGLFSFYAPGWAAEGKMIVRERQINNGIDTYYKIADASTKKDGYFMVDGTEYSSIEDAVNACETGGTIKFLGDCSFNGAFYPNKDIVIDLNGFCFSNGNSDFIYPEADVHLVVKNGTISKDKNITVSLFMVNKSENVVIDVENCTLYGYCLVFGYGTLNLDENCSGELFCMGSRNGAATLNVKGGRYTFRQWRDANVEEGTTYHIKSGYWSFDPTTYLVRPESSKVIDYGENYSSNGYRNRYFVKCANGLVIIIK